MQPHVPDSEVWSRPSWFWAAAGSTLGLGGSLAAPCLMHDQAAPPTTTTDTSALKMDVSV